MKFEKPYKGWAGWEITLFGYQIFFYNKEIHKDRKDYDTNYRAAGGIPTKKLRRFEINKVA